MNIVQRGFWLSVGIVLGLTSLYGLVLLSKGLYTMILIVF